MFVSYWIETSLEKNVSSKTFLTSLEWVSVLIMKLHIPKSIKHAAFISELNEICGAQTYQTWIYFFFSPTQRPHCSDAAG